MARDFAKQRIQGSQARPAARTQPQRGAGSARAGSAHTVPARNGGWRWYLAGLMTGFFLSFMLYLAALPPVAGTAAEGPAQPVAADPPRPRFDFYTVLPEQTMEPEVEPAQATLRGAGATTAEMYLLQAGSFRQRADADRRRAELLLLGLDPKVEETTGDNGNWFRVYIGPFNSRGEMAKARSMTAAQHIDTLLLTRNQP